MSLPRRLLPWLAAALVHAGPALAAQAGWQTLDLPGLPAAQGPGSGTTTVALFYPTAAAERSVPMGPFTPQVAPYAPPLPQVKGLLLLSHGAGGSEIGHSQLAAALARAGYLVAALRHPGDNWQDRSLLSEHAERYFDTRPRQASAVISALLAHAEWRERITRDAHGPRVGALGHSAGGYTVLALAGAEPDLAQLASHCTAHRAEDAVFCRMGSSAKGAPARPPAGLRGADDAPLRDDRVRAVVALAPVGAVFSAASLARVTVPVALYEAGQDQFLVPRFHSGWIAQHLRGVQVHSAPRAGHFASMDTPSMRLSTEGGDIGDDPAGFDRAAYLNQLGGELSAFFDQAWR